MSQNSYITSSHHANLKILRASGLVWAHMCSHLNPFLSISNIKEVLSGKTLFSIMTQTGDQHYLQKNLKGRYNNLKCLSGTRCPYLTSWVAVSVRAGFNSSWRPKESTHRNKDAASPTAVVHDLIRTINPGKLFSWLVSIDYAVSPGFNSVIHIQVFSDNWDACK